MKELKDIKGIRTDTVTQRIGDAHSEKGPFLTYQGALDMAEAISDLNAAVRELQEAVLLLQEEDDTPDRHEWNATSPPPLLPSEQWSDPVVSNAANQIKW